MTRDEAVTEVLTSLHACRVRIANLGQITSESLKRRALLEVELPHELKLLAMLEHFTAETPVLGRPTGWDHITKDDK